MTYPTIRPELTLDFANSRQLDPRITFSRSSSATYLNPDTGLITLVSDHEARFEKEGLLIEESRTNLFDESEDLQAWTSARWTKTNNVVISPDGTLNAASFVANVGTTSQSSGRSVTHSQPGEYTCSVFAKPNGLTRLKMRFSGSSYQAFFDLIGDGSIHSDQNGTASILKYPNGWYKCIFTINDTVGETAQWNLGHSNNTLVDGTNGFYVWGMNVEKGAFPTSYIPTSGSTVTRSADIAQMTSDNFSSWYNQSEGALVVEYSDQGFPAADGNNKKLVSIASNNLTLMTSFRGYSLGNMSGADESKVRFVWWDDDGRTYGASTETLNKAAISYSSEPTDGLAYDGTIVTTRTNGQPQNNMIGLYLFQFQTIARLSYYNQRLTDAELQTITL